MQSPPPGRDLQITDLESKVNSFLEGRQSDNHRTGGPVRSFDHCWNYFQRTPHPAAAMEASCYALGFYLASWGMYRGGTYLFRSTNAAYLQPVVELIEERGHEFRQFDLDTYATDPDAIVEAYGEVQRTFRDHDATVVLTTKVIVGTMGFLPAFDQYFTKGIRSLYGRTGQPSFSTVNEQSISAMADVYAANKSTIDRLATTRTFTFGSDRCDGEAITKAKVLDMWGFTHGFSLAGKQVMDQ